MSTCLSSREGVKARKPHRCSLCGEGIAVGDIQDVRTGVCPDGMWTMHIHPECHAYEQTPEMRANLVDWYEDVSEPAFDRSAARAALTAIGVLPKGRAK